MRIILTVNGRDFLLPEAIDVDQIISIAEDSIPVTRGYSDRKWTEAVGSSASIEIKLVGNHTVPTPRKEEEVPL